MRPQRANPALAAALCRAAAAPYDPEAIAAAAAVSWDESAARLHEALEQAVLDPIPS